MYSSTDNIQPAYYGDTLVDPKYLAFVRGSGNYNPPPLYEQTTDRGKAYSNALNAYERNGGDQNFKYLDEKGDNDQGFKFLDEKKYTVDPRKYVVGSTGLYTENESWTRPDLEGVGNQYTDWAMKSVQQDPNVLLNFFFSDDNINYLQNRIVEEVKKIRGEDISQQSRDELLIIMRNHYQRALSGWLPHNGGNPNEVYPRGETPCSLTERLTRLNKSVLELSVKQCISGILAYKQFYKDASSMPLPLSLPVLTTMKGSRVISENVGFNSSHSFTRGIQSFNERNNIL